MLLKDAFKLAWCNATNGDPNLRPESNVDFMCWINAKSADFRKLNGITRDMVPPDMSLAFTAYLWAKE